MDCYNVKIYYYDSETQYRVYSKPIQIGKKSNSKKRKKHLQRIEFDDGSFIFGNEINDFEQNRKLSVSLNRSKQNLIGILRANRWDYFITFTFNPKLVDSRNYYDVCMKAGKFMNNLRTRFCPDLKYVLVPELHKDGEHYHLHGVIGNSDGLQVRVSGKSDRHGRIIYNIPSWKYGFNTATEVDNTCKVSNYIAKYITKDTDHLLKGKRRYWASHNCMLREECCDTLFLDNSMDCIKTLSVQGVIKHMKSIHIFQTCNDMYFIET